MGEKTQFFGKKFSNTTIIIFNKDLVQCFLHGVENILHM